MGDVTLIAPLEGVRACGKCRCGTPSKLAPGLVECRANPPTANALFNDTPKGPQLASVVSVFPMMQPDGYCFRFERGIERVEASFGRLG